MDILAYRPDSDPNAPVVTVYSPAGRMELSAQSLDNWVCKIANYFQLESELEPGDHLAVDLPARWQSVVAVLGAWRAGLVVTDFTQGAELSAPAAMVMLSDATTAVHERDDLDDFYDVFVLADDVWGRDVAAVTGQAVTEVTGIDTAIDFVAEVRVQPDAFVGTPIDSSSEVLPGVTGDELLQRPASSESVLVGPWQSVSQLCNWLVTLARGGSLVIASDPTEQIAATEKATLLPGSPEFTA